MHLRGDGNPDRAMGATCRRAHPPASSIMPSSVRIPDRIVRRGCADVDRGRSDGCCEEGEHAYGLHSVGGRQRIRSLLPPAHSSPPSVAFRRRGCGAFAGGWGESAAECRLGSVDCQRAERQLHVEWMEMIISLAHEKGTLECG